VTGTMTPSGARDPNTHPALVRQTPRHSTLHTTINPRFVGVGVGHVAWSEQTRCALCDSHQLSQLAIPTSASCSWVLGP
jgi:hypothetical protein